MFEVIMKFFSAQSSIGAILGGIMTIVITMVAGQIAATIISLLQTNFFLYTTNWITIPVLGQVILWGQAISIVIVIAVRIAVGINQGILRDEIKAPEYIFKSVGAVALIGIMPIACDLILNFGQHAVADIAGLSQGIMTTTVDTNTFLKSLEDGLQALSTGGSDVSENGVSVLTDTLLAFALNYIMIAVTCFMIISVYLQLIIRQIEMMILSVAAPWVGIKGSFENGSSQYWEFLTNLFGLCITQAIQTLFLALCFQTFNVWYDAGVGNLLASDGKSWYRLMLLLGILVATKNIPQLLDRWTFSGGSAGSLGKMIPMLMRGRGGVGAGRKFGQTVGSKIEGAVGAAKK